MAFEISERDILARIGKLKTRTRVVETPAMLPVVNPAAQVVSPRKMWEQFKCEIITTNAYIVKKNFANEAIKKGVHKFLDFPGAVMTDSGAYQILVYGAVETTPEEIIQFQEQIRSDIAVILDVPTGWSNDWNYAKWTVEETLRRAKSAVKSLTRRDILWVGPVQGGKFLELIEKSAKEMSQLPYPIYALGSPTQVMERYLFGTLVDMIMTAKMNLPPERPLHLFGAGHPFMFALAVALGCDLFDSAAYAIYARQGRYLTEYGTIKIEQLQQLPCSCPLCSQLTTQQLRSMPRTELEKNLAEHNLYMCQAELRRIKQSISEGRLWELLELRARSHPALLQALHRLKLYRDYLESCSPAVKKRGIFYFGSTGLGRPEIVRHERKIQQNYTPPPWSSVLLLLPQTPTKPFHESRYLKATWREIRKRLGTQARKVHICIYAAPFGVIPIELDEVYPLSQYDASFIDEETINYVVNQLQSYIANKKYSIVVLHPDSTTLGNKLSNACRNTCKRLGIHFIQTSKRTEPWGDSALIELAETVKEALRFGGKKPR